MVVSTPACARDNRSATSTSVEVVRKLLDVRLKESLHVQQIGRQDDLPVLRMLASASSLLGRYATGSAKIACCFGITAKGMRIGLTTPTNAQDSRL